MNLDYFLNSWKQPTYLKNMISYLNYGMFGNIFKNQNIFEHHLVKWENEIIVKEKKENTKWIILYVTWC